MKHFSAFSTLSLIAIFFANDLTAQSTSGPWCVDLCQQNYSEENSRRANSEYEHFMLRRNPGWFADRAAYEQQTQVTIAARNSNPTAQTVITIPIVFHVVYNLPAEYVTDAQVYSQMVVINEDFARQAADTSQTPVPFQAFAANTGIQFCLAQRDPWGNPTTGIERRQTNVTDFYLDDGVKFYSSGGMDIWDPTRYFNVWVCNTTGVCWGEFPTGTVSNTHGAVMHYQYFGSQYTQYGTFPNISGYFDRGEIMCHEIGHALNLRHIWGDDGTACSGSDSCADTPNQQGPSSACPTFPMYDSCTTSGDGIMYCDYMDYTSDECLNMFTLGQAARINATLSMPPYNALASSNGCVPVTLFANDASISGIDIPNGTVCSTNFNPVITLRNLGATPLTSCMITSRVDANAPLSYFWTGFLPSLGTTSVTLNLNSVSTGAHSFYVWTSQPNGFTDGQPTNDSDTSLFTVFNGGAAMPLTEGFESTTFVPVNWTLVNPDAGNTWSRSTAASTSGVASARMNNLTYGQIGPNDDMVTMPLDLSSIANPELNFQVAYTYYHYSNPPTDLYFTDSLTVLISTDCGATQSVLYAVGGMQLATATPVTNTSVPFVPLPNEWRLETISLAPYQNSPDAIITFRNTTGWGNQLYIDDINIYSTVGMDESAEDGSISVFPNPASGVFTVSGAAMTEVKVFDVTGNKVIAEDAAGTDEYTVDLSGMRSGVYFLQVTTETGVYSQKIVKE